MERQISILGAAFGWGAQKGETERGADVLRNMGVGNTAGINGFKTSWEGVLYSPIPRGGHEKSHEEGHDFVHEYNDRLCQRIKVMMRHNKLPVVLGGDHSVAIGTWSGVVSALQAEEQFGLIWFDAHMDAHTIESSPSSAYHGMPLATLLGQGEERMIHMGSKKAKLSPQHVSLVGIRSFEPEEKALLEKLNVRVYYMEEIQERGFDAVFKEALQRATNGTKGFGMTMDLDGFDPAVAPGTGSLEEGGLTADEVLPSLEKLAHHPKFKAFEVVEYNPKLDKGNVTAKLVDKILLAVFGRKA